VNPPKLILYAVACAWFAMPFEQSLAAEAPSALVGDVGDVVVTAQRRSERSRDIPIFINAFSGQDLARMQATDTAELGKIVPSLVMTRTGRFTQPYLRGVGKRAALGVENSVATYIDGVYLASPINALIDLRGIDRIEVLNGPQGTLFGRNTTGGVIQIVTREPTPKFSGEWTLEAGSYGYARGDAYVTGGSDRLAGNLALSISRHGGYGTNIHSGKSDRDAMPHSLVVRSKWVWQPADALKLTMAADYQDVDQDFIYLPVAGFLPIGHPGATDFRDADQDGSNRQRFRYGGSSLRADVELGSVTLMSLTAFRWLNTRARSDLDRGPQPLWSTDSTARQTQVSQEIQLQSGDSARIRWVAGFYYIDVAERYDPTIFRYGGSYSALLGGRLQQTLLSRGNASSWAIYGQVTLPIAERTNLTLGARYTVEHRSVRARGEQVYASPPLLRPLPGLPLPTQPSLRDGLDFREPSWRASLDRHFSDQLMAYVAVSRGFQSGGWNLQTPQNPPFRPERLIDVEAGLKYVDRAHRFGADVNVFHYDYSDLQLTTITPMGSVTANAASAGIYGLELQLDARPDRATHINAGLQLLHAKFRRFPNASCISYHPGAPIPYVQVPCDATHNDLPFAPRLKLSLGADHRFSLGSIGSVTLAGNLMYNAGYFSEPDNLTRQKRFATVDASLEWAPNARGPSVRIWVRNLTNARYYDSLVSQPPAGIFYRPAAPRRLGASIAGTF